MDNDHKASHYHNFFTPAFSFLLFFLLRRVVVRLSLAVRSACGFSWRRGCVTPPYGNLGSKLHHFTITGVGVRELDASATSTHSLHETAVLRLSHAAKPRTFLESTSLLYIRRNCSRSDASKIRKYESAKVQSLYYI